MSGMEFRFDLGRLSLNFVATVGSRCTPHPVERIASPALLAEWLRESGVMPSKEPLPAIGQKELDAAIALREVLYRLIHDIHHAQEPQPADIEILNKTAQRSHPPVPQLQRGKKKNTWESKPLAPITMSQLLALIARDAIDLLAGEDRALMRECAGHACDGIYVDRSRGFRRQWCSSKTCGNQARVDRFREKAAVQ